MCSKISNLPKIFGGAQITHNFSVRIQPDGIHSSPRNVRVFCPYREYHHSSEDKETPFSNVKLLGASTLVAASIFSSFFDDGGKSKEDTLKKHIGMCTMHLHQAEPHFAKPHFEQAYELLKDDLDRTKETPIPNLRIAYLTDQLGNIALQLECYKEAINLYMATINGFALNGIERSNRTVTELFLKIGQIYAILGEYKLAEMSFLHCVGVTTLELSKSDEPKNPTVSTLAGLAYEGLGKVYLSMNLPENALNMYKHAFQFAGALFDPNDPQIPVLLNDFATVYEALDQYDMALEKVENAIEKAKVANQAALPSIMCNKATILLFSGDLISARSLYEELLQTCLRIQDYETIREINANLKILKEKERLQKECLAE
ncbi:uncharacterized protein LOC134825046 [Bolinopsis microptera]|uniref:uncharacterized protein LOC134825046 n=1 Tax=Bolinopsis microptera TaxID=2820187 RepID=UPI0030791B50